MWKKKKKKGPVKTSLQFGKKEKKKVKETCKRKSI